MPTSSVAHLSVGASSGRDAFVAQTRRFLAAAEALDDHALLSASRCHGWAVLDVVVHVRAGLEEMLRGATAPTELAPTVDAATYWSAWTEAEDRGAVVDGILWTRRTASAYRRPITAVKHLRDAAEAIIDAASRLSAPAVAFQGHVLATGDFLATWAVELAVHHVDMGRELDVGLPSGTALQLTRRTVSALLGVAVPDDITDLEALLIGSGRTAAPDDRHPVRRVLG